ncbi:MAG: S1 RNA-binding domain-containing protein, partial [Planctomycetaceae bacterium]|nr:S1 RNA-binding domain-containing protein [Planctomycetaceae bacterium]
NRFIRSPHEVVSVGDVVTVWVLDVDLSRRRVSLTMLPPEN